jgi:HPt (histidine-containing phosphotransfer) domain-containing protein
MHEALASGDSERLASLAHAMKGSGGLFGANALSVTAEELEDATERGALGEAAAVVARLDVEFAGVIEVLAQEIYESRYRAVPEESVGSSASGS